MTSAQQQFAGTFGDGTDPARVFSAIDALIKIDREDELKAMRTEFSDMGVGKEASRIDPWASSGGLRETSAMSMRIMALTEPGKYQTERPAAINLIKSDVETAFNTAFNNYKAAGYPVDHAEEEALKTAKLVKEAGYKALSAKFGDDELFLKGTAHNSTAFKVPR